MTRRRKEKTGSVTLRRKDDGVEFEMNVYSTFREERDMHGITKVEDRLKEIVSPDGRSLCSDDEQLWYFCDEPGRLMEIV
jgi:hypothetical protein